MHQGPSQMVVEGSALSMIHVRQRITNAKCGNKFEPGYRRSTINQHEMKKYQKCTQGGESKTAGSCHLFAHAAEGSDAGARFGVRLSGVPPWEIQQECTDELIGQDLVWP